MMQFICDKCGHVVLEPVEEDDEDAIE